MADRTLVITSVPPWPLHRNGGAQRTALLVRALRDLGGEVDLVAVLPDVGEPLPPREVMAAAGLRDAVLVPNDLPPEGRSRLPGPAGGLANVLRLWSFRYAARPAAVGRVADLLPGYGRVVVRYLQTALLCGLDAAPPDVRSRVEVDLDDVDWLTLRSRFAADPWPGIGGRLAMRLVLRQVRRRCLSALENLSPRYVASDEDAAELAREGVAARVLPNVPFFEEGQGPPAPLDPSGPASRRVLFVGDLKFPPNRDGLERLLEKSWPAVRSGTPGATLRVVGRGVDEESRARWSAHAGVDVLGFAEDLRAEYAAAAATVAPVWYGGGTKIKVVESAALGRACVAATPATRGYSGLVGRGVVAADDDAAVSAALARLLADVEFRAAQERAGPAATAGRYDLAAIRAALAGPTAPACR